jgi:hypothetical protein
VEARSLPVHAFVDTNIRLHYLPLEQIDWRSVLAAEAVVLHIAPIVTRELDHHKWGSNDRLRKRADRLLRADHAVLVSGSTKLRESVDISFDPTEPSEDTFTKYRLSQKSNDDHLLASVLEFRDANPGVDLIVVAADFGLKVKAHHASVKAVALGDDVRLPEDPDDKDREIKRLREENDVLKHRVPRLKLAFIDASTHMKIRLPPPDDLEAEKRALRDAIREEHPYKPIKKKEPPKDDPWGVLASVADSSFSEMGVDIDNRQNQAHNTALKKFFDKHDAYLDEDLDHKRRSARTVEVVLQVMNEGSGVADDVDAFIEIKGVAHVFTEETRPNPPPEPQRHALLTYDMLSSSVTLADVLKQRDEPDHEDKPVVSESADRWRVRFRVARVKQGLEAPLPAIYVELLDDRDCGV